MNCKLVELKGVVRKKTLLQIKMKLEHKEIRHYRKHKIWENQTNGTEDNLQSNDIEDSNGDSAYL